MLAARDSQQKLLVQIRDKGLVASVFATGLSGTGKTTTVKTVFSTSVNCVYVNCDQIISQTLLFRVILDAFCVQYSANVSTLHHFTAILSDLLLSATNSRFFIILDNAHSLRALPAPHSLISSFLRLNELCTATANSDSSFVTTILVSHLPFSAFKEFTLDIDPSLTLYFPAYSKTEIREILKLEYITRWTHEHGNIKTDSNTSNNNCTTHNETKSIDRDDIDSLGIEKTSNNENIDAEDVDFFMGFVDLTLQVLSVPCRDLVEIRYVIGLLWDTYREPVLSGKCKKSDLGKLATNIRKCFKDVLDKLYIRHISSSEWKYSVKPTVSMLQQPTKSSGSLDTIDLPYNACYILIASFIASYNPKGLDVRFFARASEKRTKKAIKVRESKKLRQQLLGPKPFPLDRMLAIYHRLKQDQHTTPTAESLVDLHMHVTSLVSKGMLIRMTPAGRIEDVKVKVNVGVEVVWRVAGRIGLDVGKYLYDFRA